MAQQLVRSQEDERARLSRELHDGISQVLVSIKLSLEAARERLRQSLPEQPQALAHIDRPLGGALDRLNSAVGEVRRISHNLRPTLLDDLGLPAALEHLGREFAIPSTDGAPPLAVRLRTTGRPVKLPDAYATALFRVTQEALTNVMRHAGATRADMTLAYSAHDLRLTISDDGRGFDFAAVQQDPRRGIGLRNMRERMSALSGLAAPAGRGCPYRDDLSMTDTPDAIRLLLVDDHPLVRDGLRLRLETVPRLRVVGEAGNAQAALAFLATCLAQDPQGDTLPHLVLMDLNMPGVGGLELTALLHERYPQIAVLVLSMHDNPEYMVQAVKAGARGYLLKDEPAEEIVTAIGAVVAGRTYFSAAAAVRLSQASAPATLLTQRERDVLRHIADGQANKQIALALGLSVRTVETHRLNIKRKLGIDGQAELIKYAVENRGV
ncbi:hypothetical protein G6F22_012978 [Rhizopus arrhizus]|nr:hypothetical protein G6F22_012978 [Rhizopus arrhizus]